MDVNHGSRSLKDGVYNIIDVHWEEDAKDARWRRILTLQDSDGTLTTINYHPILTENNVTLIGRVLERRRTCRSGAVRFSLIL
jgi:hypothetical protein